MDNLKTQSSDALEKAGTRWVKQHGNILRLSVTILAVAAICVIFNVLTIVWFPQIISWRFSADLAGTLLVAISIVMFAIAPPGYETGSLRRFGLCIFCCILVLMAIWVVLPKVDGYFYAARYDQATSEILALANQIDELRTTEGRLPGDEAQLVEWLGTQMPVSPWKDRIKYSIISDQTLAAGDIKEHYVISSAWKEYGVSLYYHSWEPERRVICESYSP